MPKNTPIITELESKLLNQDFTFGNDKEIANNYKSVAAMYAKIENSIAVLSDLSTNKSYIYYGDVAESFGLGKNKCEELNSIWEEDIYNLIHPDDLAARHIQELHYFMLLKKSEKNQRRNLFTLSNLRMRNTKGDYVSMLHRTIYFCNTEDGLLWFALCLYNFAYSEIAPRPFCGVIQNSATGETYPYSKNLKILTDREIEILKYIENGYRSKEIANKLCLSINTINRHRQNIIEKLCVSNSVEAIRKAHQLKILP